MYNSTKKNDFFFFSVEPAQADPIPLDLEEPDQRQIQIICTIAILKELQVPTRVTILMPRLLSCNPITLVQFVMVSTMYILLYALGYTT